MTRDLAALTPPRGREIALVHRANVYSGDALNAAADALADELSRSGVRAGCRVALRLGNCPEFVVSLLAAMRLGASSVLLGPYLSDTEVADLVARTRAVAVLAPLESSLSAIGCSLVGGPVTLSHRAGVVLIWRTAYDEPVAGPDELTVQFTSGVSGRPKLIARTTQNLQSELENCAPVLGVVDGPTVCPSPVCHAYGLVDGLLLPLFIGHPCILVDSFVPNVLIDTIRDCRAAVLVGVPVMYQELSRAYGADPRSLTSLRLALSTGSALSSDAFEAFFARYAVRISQQYGSSETGVISVNLSGTDPLAVGRPIPGCRVDIVDERGGGVDPGESGEITVHTAAAANQYLDDPALSAMKFRDGRYFTGDLGRLSSSGELTVVGRRTSFINVAGLKVDPIEVEQVLESCDAVVESAVVAHQNGAQGETVQAFVVTRRPISIRDLQKFCRRRLASYKVPTRVTFLTSLPRSATGKVMRSSLTAASHADAEER